MSVTPLKKPARSKKATIPTKEGVATETSDPSASSRALPNKPRKKRSLPREDKKTANRQSEEGGLYYVGIGASAGGLEALRPFVANLPVRANMTYIVAQHMSPDYRSMMVELLARETKLVVEEAPNNVLPKANTIYVAPPNADVSVVRGKLRISRPTNAVGPKPSVDRLFISLADECKDHAIGIVLSGTGSDGAHGIKAIKAAGGITIAQDPASAKYDSMPKAAIRVGRADLVLSSPQIATQLNSIVQWPRASIAEEADEVPPSTIKGIVRQIASYTRMDFSNYKDATISRQVMRRMTAMQIPNLKEYGEYVNKHHEELSELAGNFLICVTSFFRDKDSFEAIRKSLSEVLRNKQPGDDIRIWVPGCATGEEVYSFAIILADELGEHRDKYRIQIFATDINGEAVSAARAGLYPEAALSGIDAGTIGRYFSVRDGMYLVDKSLRDMTLFARQDLVQDPPFVRVDMISCRNLLIYFKVELQERVLNVFHYALRQNGILFLGKSETVGRKNELFAEYDSRNKIYVKRGVSTPVVTGFSRLRGPLGFEQDRDIVAEKIVPPSSGVIAHNRLFELYTPPSFLMTDSGQIIELVGDCSPFLTVRKGKADFNAYSLIKPAFRAELRAFTHRVARSKDSALSNPVEISVDGRPLIYQMAVHFCGKSASEESDLLLVSFEVATSKKLQLMEIADGNSSGERIMELEKEIALTRENLQTVIEELETANEELQSLNEEAQASNEEMQASNEELETANEELQSSNEELITVNDELNTRSHELIEANNDLTNILDSLYKGMLVVDRNLTVTRFNNLAMEFFDVPSDSRPNLTTIATDARVPDLLKHVGRAMKSGKLEEFEFKRDDARIFLVRLHPYTENDNKKIKGVVITVTEVTEQKAIEQKLRLSASVFEHAAEATMVTDADNKILSVNPAFTAITGYSPDEAIGKDPKFLSSGRNTVAFYEEMWKALHSEGMWKGEIENKRKNGDEFFERISINVLKDEHEKITRHIAVFHDITEERKAQATIERQASFDALTGLPNRSLTFDRLKQLFASSRRNGRIFAVLFMDLDNFKSVNDALGHVAGDELLSKTAARIKKGLRDADSVGRMGGDEFVVLLSDLNCIDDIIPLADSILAEVRRPLVVAGHRLQTAASIGITVYPMDGDTPDVMLKNADSAMYEAKKKGRNTFCFFTHKMQDDAIKRHWIETELATAIDDERLQLLYQPILRIDTMQIAGAEALLRWEHPARGSIPPEAFIPVSEQNGTIGKITQWVFETGLKDWTKCRNHSNSPLSLSFNVSAAHFVSRDHMENLLGLLKKNHSERNHQIVIEITESLKLSDNVEYVDLLKQFRQYGCRIAIDDFGTGYSSLNYLKRMPIDIIKIDKSFVRDIVTDGADAATTRAILQMAASFGMETIAEGVETEKQLAFLKAQGCTYVQGFLFSKAVSIGDFLELTTRPVNATDTNNS